MDGIELMASAMHAMQARVDVAAGNLANASSDGFRRSVAHVALERRGLTTRSSADATPGAFRHTGRSLDLCTVAGRGMLVRDAAGRVAIVRSASFEPSPGGVWRDAKGRVLLGERGAVRANGDASVDERGNVSDASGRHVAHIRLVPGTALQSGLLEASNVDAVHEMVDLLAAQRAFETAEKTLAAIDETRARGTSDVARVKA